MKDKTHSMNAGGGEGAQKGYTDAGSPGDANAYHKRRMEQGNLAGNAALTEFENPSGDGGGTDVGGFVKRNNYSSRR